VVQRRIPAANSSEPASPCVRDCCLDEADVCMGCGRSLQEILQWHAASAEEREAIKAAAKLRLDERRSRQRW
jgi:predicted Fe-S protein YdhL (DUF1289 family)